MCRQIVVACACRRFVWHFTCFCLGNRQISFVFCLLRGIAELLVSTRHSECADRSSWLALVGVLFGILRVSVWETAKFLLFFAFYVVLPGYWAVRGIRKVQ